MDCLFDRKRKAEDHLKAAHWVFGRSNTDFNMEKCCGVLGTRRDVLRLRIHYEFWRRWYVFPIEFPFMIDPVPDSVDGELFMIGGQEGYALARAAWGQPGIRTAALMASARESTGKSEEKLREVLQTLADKYLMSQQNDSWYLTGRNPVLRSLDQATATFRANRNQLSWSRMF